MNLLVRARSIACATRVVVLLELVFSIFFLLIHDNDFLLEFIMSCTILLKSKVQLLYQTGCCTQFGSKNEIA